MQSTPTLAPAPATSGQAAALRQALLASVTPDDMVAIARALVEKAKKGDTTAARLVLSYVLGKPGPAVPPDRHDTAERAGRQEDARTMPELPPKVPTPSPDQPVRAARPTGPALTKEMARLLGDMLAHPENFHDGRPDLELANDLGPSPNGAREPMASPSRSGRRSRPGRNAATSKLTVAAIT